MNEGAEPVRLRQKAGHARSTEPWRDAPSQRVGGPVGAASQEQLFAAVYDRLREIAAGSTCRDRSRDRPDGACGAEHSRTRDREARVAARPHESVWWRAKLILALPNTDRLDVAAEHGGEEHERQAEPPRGPAETTPGRETCARHSPPG
jgi:hypothetical protein